MKKMIIASMLLASTLSQAQILNQVTTSEEPVKDALDSLEIHYGGSSRTIDIGNGFLVSPKVQAPDGVTEFAIRSPGANGGERLYNFEFPERARQGIVLRITDDTQSTDGLSARLLETSLYFFPRKVIPSVEAIDGGAELTLPTGEKVLFSEAKRIVSGVLTETSPLDLTQDRSKRKFAQLKYTGEGLTIRVDRRAGTPETIYNVPYNVNEDIKNATLTYKGKICKVPKALLWDQNESRGFFFLYSTDEEFYSKVVIPKCGWTDLPL